MSSFKQLKAQRDARDGSRSGLKSIQVDVSPIDQDIVQVSHTAENPQRRKQVIGASTSSSSKRRLDENDDVEADQSEGKGRGLFWKPKGERVKCSKGTTIFRLEPDVALLSTDRLATHCYHCFASAEESSLIGPSSKSPATSFQRCSACKVVRYCSSKCQKSDWASHKAECKSLQGYALTAKRGRKQDEDDEEETKTHAKIPPEPGNTVRELARLIWSKKRLGEGWWSRIEDLYFDRSLVTEEEVQSMAELSIAVAKFIQSSTDITSDEARKRALEDLGFSSPSQLLNLIGKVGGTMVATVLLRLGSCGVCTQYRANSFTMASSDLSPVGGCINVTAALINHSCQPNAAFVFPEGPSAAKPMRLVAIKDIEPGEEILTSYIDISDAYSVRQQTLRKRYLFRCGCKACKRVERGKNVDPREAVWCNQARCSGWLGRLQTTCLKCRKEGNVDWKVIEENTKEGEAAIKTANQYLSQGEPMLAYRSLRESIRQLPKILPPSSYPLLSVLRTAQTSLIYLASTAMDASIITVTEMFDEATRFGMLIIAGMQATMNKEPLFPTGHPVRAVALATLGKLLLVDAEARSPQKLQPASSKTILPTPPTLPEHGLPRVMFGQKILREAYGESKIGMGRENDGGQTGRSVAQTLRSLEEEMQMMANGGQWRTIPE